MPVSIYHLTTWALSPSFTFPRTNLCASFSSYVVAFSHIRTHALIFACIAKILWQQNIFNKDAHVKWLTTAMSIHTAKAYRRQQQQKHKVRLWNENWCENKGFKRAYASTYLHMTVCACVYVRVWASRDECVRHLKSPYTFIHVPLTHRSYVCLLVKMLSNAAAAATTATTSG